MAAPLPAGPSAYRLLVGCEGSPFAPSASTKPVVDVLAGRATNDAIDAGAWLDALDAARGTVAIYFSLPADHEWWLAYDAGAGAGESPFQRWSRYPSGEWNHDAVPRATIEQSIVDLGIGRDGDSATIYRSRVVPTWEAPLFVRERVTRPEVTDTAFGIDFDTDSDTALGTESDTVPDGDGDDMDAGENA